jgi:hypothetical protein
LPVERQPVAEFADQYIGDQAGPRPAALDRQLGRRRLEHRLAFAACIAWADMANDLEPRWDLLQHLADIFTKADQPGPVAIATDAENLRFVHDSLARQMRRQWFSDRRLARFALDRVWLVCCRLLGRLFRSAFLEIFQAQFQLLDLGRQPF